MEKRFVTSMKVAPVNTKVSDVKSRLIEEYNKQVPEDKQLSIDQVRVRVPRFEDDLGDVLKDTETLENADLFDGKQIYL